MKGTNILATIVLMFGVVYFNCYQFVSDSFWFRCTAFEHMLQALLGYSLAKKIGNTYTECLTALILGFTLNNYLDEVMFDPTKLQLNEIIFSLIFTITILLRYGKNIRITK